MKFFPESICLIFIALYLGSCGQPTGNKKGTIPVERSQDLEEANWSEQGDFEEKVSAYEDESRDIWQKPDRVMDLLGPMEDKTVIDLGAGTGYFAFRLIGQAKKVIAVDIDAEFVRFMRDRKKLLPEDQQEKFEVRLATAEDPMIGQGEADAVLIVNTYAYLPDRIAYFKHLHGKLKENAKLVIIEFKMKNIPNGPPLEEKVPILTVEEELKKAGFQNIEIDDRSLDYQYIVTARS